MILDEVIKVVNRRGKADRSDFGTAMQTDPLFSQRYVSLQYGHFPGTCQLSLFLLYSEHVSTSAFDLLFFFG